MHAVPNDESRPACSCLPTWKRYREPSSNKGGEVVEEETHGCDERKKKDTATLATPIVSSSKEASLARRLSDELSESADPYS